MRQGPIKNDIHRIIEISLLGVGADRKLLYGFASELGTSQSQRLLPFLTVSSFGLPATRRLGLVRKLFFGLFRGFFGDFFSAFTSGLLLDLSGFRFLFRVAGGFFSGGRRVFRRADA